MKKRVESCIILMLVGIMAMAGSAVSFAEEQVELRLTWWGSQNRHNKMIEVIKLFEKEHPNIRVIYEFSGWRDYFTKLTTQAAGGNLPDVMQQNYDRLSEWTGNGLLLPLDKYIESGEIDLTNVSEGVLQSGKVHGKQCGLPLGTNSLGMVLDLDAFEKAGVEIPAQNWTWEDYERIATQLSEKLGIWGGGGTLSDHIIWTSLLLGYGETAYAADGKSLGHADDTAIIKHLEMLLRLIEAVAYMPRDIELAEYFTSGAEGSALVQGKGAMVAYWSNQLPAIWKAAGEDRNLTIIHLPRPKDGCCPSNFIKPSMFFSITKDAKHPKEAAMFIDFIINNADAAKILLIDRGVPISSEIREVVKELLDKSELESMAFVGRVEDDSSPLPSAEPPAYSDVYTNVFLPEFIDPVLFGEISPEKGAEIFREMATDILSK